MMRLTCAMVIAAATLGTIGCQSPTSSSSSFNVDNFVDATITPNPSTAVASTDGRTYRVVRGNNQPDDVLPFQFITTYDIVLTFNANATNSSNNLTFPVTITSATAKVEQASSGIVTTPSSGDVEHYDSAIVSSTTNAVSQVGAGVEMVFKAWYALPNTGREALITETISMKDSSDTPQTFAKTVQVRVSP
ncbi:MAG: hypothetical protein ABJA98_04370 [Acidobacteriota bacterium]